MDLTTLPDTIILEILDGLDPEALFELCQAGDHNKKLMRLCKLNGNIRERIKDQKILNMIKVIQERYIGMDSAPSNRDPKLLEQFSFGFNANLRHYACSTFKKVGKKIKSVNDEINPKASKLYYALKIPIETYYDIIENSLENGLEEPEDSEDEEDMRLALRDYESHSLTKLEAIAFILRFGNGNQLTKAAKQKFLELNP